MAAEEKENMDTLPAGKVEENAPNMELPVPSREVTLDSSPKPVSYTHLDVYKRQCRYILLHAFLFQGAQS